MTTTTTVYKARWFGDLWEPGVRGAGSATIAAALVDAGRPRVAASTTAMIVEAVQSHLEATEGDWQVIDRLDVRRATTIETCDREGEFETYTRCTRTETLVEFCDDDEAAWCSATFGDVEDDGQEAPLST